MVRTELHFLVFLFGMWGRRRGWRVWPSTPVSFVPSTDVNLGDLIGFLDVYNHVRQLMVATRALTLVCSGSNLNSKW